MTAPPVLDTRALARLGEELCDVATLCGFLRRYASMLEQRLDRLEHARATEDREAWMDAVLSLKTSSSLACAEALAAEAAALQEESRASTSVTCTSIVCDSETIEALRRLAAETARQLRAYVQQQEPSTPPLS